MSESLRDLVVSLSLNTDNFTRNIKSVNKQIQEAESYFKLASAGVQNFENTAAGLQSKLDMLQKKLTLQEQVVGQYEKALTQASAKLQECYDRQNTYAARLEQAKTRQEALKDVVDQARDAYKQYRDSLGDADSATIAANANLKAAEEEYRAASDEVKKLAGQYNACQKATQNAADAFSTGQKNLNNAQAAVRDTEASIRTCNQELTLAQTKWAEAGEKIKGTEQAITAIGKQMQLAESEFHLASAGIKDIEGNADVLAAKLTSLNTIFDLQNKAVEQYEQKLQAAKEQLEAAQQANDPEKIREATNAVTDAETALNNARAAVKETSAAIDETNQQLVLAQTSWYEAGEKIKGTEYAITAIGKQMQLAESEFNLAAGGIKDLESSTDGLTAKLSMLTTQYALQNQAVEQYEQRLAAAKEQLEAAQQANDPERIRQATNAVTDAQTALNHAKAAVRETAEAIQETNQQLTLAQTGWYEAGERIRVAEQAISDIGKQMQLAESEFKLASAGIKDMESNADVLSAKLDMLNSTLDLQNKAVEQYERKLQAAKEQLEAAQQANDPEKIREATNAVNEAQTALNHARAAVKETAGAINETNQQLILAQTNWYEAGEKVKGAETAITSIGKEMDVAKSRFELASSGIRDVDKSSVVLAAKITQLREELELQNQTVEQCEIKLKAAKEQLEAAQQANDPEKIRQATDAVNDAEAALNRANAAVRNTTMELRTASSSWTSLGRSMESVSQYADKVSQTTGKIGRVLTTTMTTPIVALGTSAIKASIDFESAFTGVRKTVDATEAEYEQLANTVKRMSTEIASSTTEIAGVMETAGQLGIQNDALESFSRTMIDLGNSTDIVANDAASTLAKFANIMGMDQSLFQNLGSTLVDLGNNYATTESAIMEMSMRLAGAGKQVGLSEAQILGFATALSSVGIEAQMGGSAMSKALVKMEVAAATGGDALKDFSKVCGLTQTEFKQMWAADPAAVFQRFIEGLARLDDEGFSTIKTLEDIGIKEIRLRDTMLRAVNATELFSNTQKTATKAWKQNTALADEANKRYATTESRITNLKNKATLFAQTLGNDINPMIGKVISGADGLLGKIMDMDAAERQTLIRNAAIAASIGPIFVGISKVSKGISAFTGGIGKFATAVGKAGGGFSGFISVLAKSPAVWMAVAAAIVVGTVALVDYVSGAKKAREALEGMKKTAEDWKNTAADTFYNKSGAGLSFFGMSADDFKSESDKIAMSGRVWLAGLIDVWTDGKKETNAIVKEWTDNFKAGSEQLRTELKELQVTANERGYTGLSDQMEADLKALDSMDKEIASLLKKRQNGFFSEKDKIRLQELVDAREAIQIRYNLVPDTGNTDGFETIRKKLEAEVARAQARGQDDASITVYENAVVAAAQGMATINNQIDANYDKEYALIQLISDSAEREAALANLNQRYTAERRQAALEYAALLKDIALPVFEQENIQKAASDIDLLTQKLRQYSAANEADKPQLLADLNELTSSMDESSLVEYIGLLTQIQSLLDSGISEAELKEQFPEIDFSTALDQIAAIQSFLKGRESLLPGLASMFGEALPDEMITLTTDLDMTGAQARWDEFAANPGSITTDAIIASYADAPDVVKPEVVVQAFVSGYTEIPEGADKSQLTVTGLIAYVSKYAEVTTGADVSGLTPEIVTAFVKGYKELATGADVTALKPSEIVAYISSYAEKKGVDISKLKPEAIIAFVSAYQEATGGALTTALTPTDVAAMVTEYLLAQKVDMSKITDAQVNAMVNAYAEATNVDKTALKAEVVAQITAYVEAEGVQKPSFIKTQVSITGYDLAAYRELLANHPMQVNGILRLNEVFADPNEALLAENTKFWKDGVEVPVSMVPAEMLTPDKVAVLDENGTMHILLTPKLTGDKEVIQELRTDIEEIDSLGTTALGRAIGIMPVTVMDRVDAAVARLKSFEKTKDYGWIEKFWASICGESTDKNVLNQSMLLDFDPKTLASITTYVSEVVTAIQNGDEIAKEDYENIQKIVEFLNALELAGVGENVTAGIGEAMAAAGWETDAESVASNLENALNSAFVIQSPSKRMHPVGENVAAGIGAGGAEYDFSSDASTITSSIEATILAAISANPLTAAGTAAMTGLADGMTSYSMADTASAISMSTRNAVNASLNATTLRSIGVNAMLGLASGIRAGQAGVVSAMRSAALSAVNAAKSALKIQSPSRVFEDEVGVMSMKGWGRGVTKEAKEQAKTISNAARYLTDAAKESAISPLVSHESRTYNQSSTINLSGNTFSIRDEQDIYALAAEIAALTKREQRGRGFRMA